MWAWLDEFWYGIAQDPARNRGRVFHRKFRLSGAVVEWLGSPATTELQRLAFFELLLRLDSDPVAHSEPILQANALPGMRWAGFDARKVIFIWNLPDNRIHVLTCV